MIDSVATLDQNFCALLAEFTAGDPMRQGVLWTNLSRREISRRLAEMGTPASRHVVRKLLKKHGLGYAQGVQEKVDGRASRSQRAVRKHRPHQGRVSLAGTAR